MAEACSKNPFVLVTEDDMCELIDDFDAENTKEQVRYAVNRMNAFAACADTTSLENLTDLELDN